MARYIIPKSDQYIIGDNTYFRIKLPAEAKLWALTSNTGTTYMSVNLRDLQLNTKNLDNQGVRYLRAICKYVLNQDATKSPKKEVIKTIIDNMEYEA
jgi:hypothetical protein